MWSLDASPLIASEEKLNTSPFMHIDFEFRIDFTTLMQLKKQSCIWETQKGQFLLCYGTE